MNGTERPGFCETCGRALEQQKGRGRYRRYCDASCRSAARRRRASEEGVKQTLTATSRQGNLDAMDTETPSTGSAAQPLDALAAALGAVRDAETGLRDAVDTARDAGRTWTEIGDVLGTTRQAAFQRFGRPVDPRTGEPMNASVLPGAAEAAVALFVALVEGRWEEVRRDFDQKVAEALPDAAAVAGTWAGLSGRLGRYEGRMGAPFAHQLGDYTVVDVPLEFEVGTQTGRVSFSRDGKIAGIFVLPPEAV
jgi:hypothetical protein